MGGGDEEKATYHMQLPLGGIHDEIVDLAPLRLLRLPLFNKLIYSGSSLRHSGLYIRQN